MFSHSVPDVKVLIVEATFSSLKVKFLHVICVPSNLSLFSYCSFLMVPVVVLCSVCTSSTSMRPHPILNVSYRSSTFPIVLCFSAAQENKPLSAFQRGLHKTQWWKRKSCSNSRSFQKNEEASGTFPAGRDRLWTLSLPLYTTCRHQALDVSSNRKIGLWCQICVSGLTSCLVNWQGTAPGWGRSLVSTG